MVPRRPPLSPPAVEGTSGRGQRGGPPRLRGGYQREGPVCVGRRRRALFPHPPHLQTSMLRLANILACGRLFNQRLVGLGGWPARPLCLPPGSVRHGASASRSRGPANASSAALSGCAPASPYSHRRRSTGRDSAPVARRRSQRTSALPAIKGCPLPTPRPPAAPRRP